MAPKSTGSYLLLLAFVIVFCLASPAAAFGAGNIASISKVEGQNFRHGDIEDFLKTVACLKGHKWTTMMIKRVYFGNWLRDYSQAVDVGTLKGVQADTIRILVWILSFMTFGYATVEFEVTSERLGVYRPEEHIDNPRDYADNVDARQFDKRLRGPVSQQELEIDPNTGMKNYMANESGGWATSLGYIKFSFQRSIHFGRLYTSGGHGVCGREEDLCEALRCLGQGLHCLEDFGAHTNYTELALHELGYHNVFPHTGTATRMNIRGKQVFPLVTGTFGGVDFLHSVLGEATDHFTQADVNQSEIDQMNATLGNAVSHSKRSASGSNECEVLTGLLSKMPGTSNLCREAQSLQASADAQSAMNWNAQKTDAPQFAAPPGSVGGPPGPGIPGMNPNLDPATIVPKIYPILEFRDKVVRAISAVVSKIPGLESLIDTITERVTIFVFSLLAPFIQPIIAAASNSLKAGSGAVINSSARHQYVPWTDPHCTDPTHSMLSKDHFSNILNEPAGKVAAAILQYVAPRIVYAWEHPDVQQEQILDDVGRVFHHPALRDKNLELHRNMFNVVEQWSRSRGPGSPDLNVVLSSDSVRNGKNHTTANIQESLQPGIALFNQQTHGGGGHSHGSPLSFLTSGGGNPLSGLLGSKQSPFNLLSTKRDIDDFAAGSTSGGYDTLATGVAGSDLYGTASSHAPNQPYASTTPRPYQGGYDQGYGQPPPQYFHSSHNQAGYGQQPPPAQGDWRPTPEGEQNYGNWNPNVTGSYGRHGDRF